jgi:hypothetical protein
MNTWSYQYAAKPKTIRRTFFSFHFVPDNQRAEVVQQSWLTKEDRQAAGFFDGSAFETKKRTSKDALKQFLSDQLKGTSVTCVLVGSETALRPWVRYELVRSFHRGNGLLAIRIHGIRDWNKQTATPGPNPFDYLAYRIANERVYWQQLNNGVWSDYDEVPSLAVNEVAYNLNRQLHHTFSCLFPIYDWSTGSGYANLGAWIEQAAKHAGK